MPIYAYRCSTCGHAKDVLQKVSDPALTVCPACGAATFAKQLTAAGFQLKGSGWYATDFKGGAKKTDGDGAKTDTATTEAGKAERSAEPAGAKSGDSTGAAKSGDAPASTSASSAPKAAGCGRSCACH